MGNKQNVEQRLNWIDMAKGYGIILVIIGHTTWLDDYTWSSIFCGVIYSFHMPLFFMISGYLMNPMKYDAATFIKKRVKTMLIPYIFFGLIIVFANWVFYDLGNFAALGNYLLALVVQNRFHVIWYLGVLFISEIVLYYLVRILKDVWWQILLISILLAIAGIAYYAKGGGPLPWNIDVVPNSVMFLAIGYVLRKVKFKNNTKFLYIGVLTNIFCGTMNIVIVGGGLEMFGGRYAIFPLTVLGAMGGVYVVYWISCKKTFKVISHIGRHSLVYFGLHQALTITLFDMICASQNWFPAKNNIVQGMAYIIIEVVFSLVLLAIVQLPMSKTKAKILIGE